MSARIPFSGNLFAASVGGGVMFAGGLFQVTGAPPPPDITSDVCLAATRTGVVDLEASTEHARQCEGTNVTCSALNQTVQIPPTGNQLWTFTLPLAQVPSGGIGAWPIVVGFSPTPNADAVHTEIATVTQGGQPAGVDATFTIELNADDLDGFAFDSVWYWSCWRTDTGNVELLAGATLLGMSCVTLP